MEECSELNQLCRQQCPILALTLALLLALPIAAVPIARRRSQGQGRPEDVKDTIATTTIDQHCHTTAAASEVDDSHFNAAFAAAVNIAAATTVAASPAPLPCCCRHRHRRRPALFFGLSDFSSVSLDDEETARQKMYCVVA